MFKISYLISAFCALLLLCSPATAQEATLELREPFAYPPIGAANVGVAFMQIHNPTQTDYQLRNVTSDSFARIELHTHLHEEGIMKMRKIDAIDIPAGETVSLQSGGLHLMLFDATTSIKVGDSLNLQLTFATMPSTSKDAAPHIIQTSIPVRARTGKTPSDETAPDAEHDTHQHH